jgi:pimeloyl-ACP methyl ester carboxylesterase
MAAIVKALSRAPGTEVEVETLKTIAMFCGAGLLVSLLFATYGIDLSTGVFWPPNRPARQLPHGTTKKPPLGWGSDGSCEIFRQPLEEKPKALSNAGCLMSRTTAAFLGIAAIISISIAAICLTSEPLRGWLDFYAWRFFAGKAHGGHFADLNKVSIYYETYGAGPPVLVLHGGLGSHEGMRNQIRALANSHLVIAPDSRGQGRSTDSDLPLTYSVMADDMAQLLDHLQTVRVDVVGWSDGGIVGLDLAMRYPERVRRLVAISANYDVTGIPQSSTAEVNVPRTPIRYRLLAKEPAHWPIIYRKVAMMWQTQPKYSLDDLGRIKAPTLILAGEFDFIIAEHTAKLAKAIPGSQEIIVEGATHTVPTDKPDVVNKIILNFLGRRGWVAQGNASSDALWG